MRRMTMMMMVMVMVMVCEVMILTTNTWYHMAMTRFVYPAIGSCTVFFTPGIGYLIEKVGYLHFVAIVVGIFYCFFFFKE